MSNSLHKQLLKVQERLKVPKDQYNNFGKYRYRSAESILEAVKPLNAEHGLLLTLTDEPLLIGEWHYIKATARITNGEETHEVTAYARESQDKKGMDHMQITGTASSYARKYALNGLYLIDDTKDADTDEYQKQSNKPQQQKSKQPTEKQLTIQNKLGNLMQQTGKNKGDAIKELGYTNKQFTTLYNGSEDKQQELIEKLEGKLNDYANVG